MAQCVITLDDGVHEDRMVPYLVLQYGICNPRKDRWLRGVITAEVPDPDLVRQDPWVRTVREVGAPVV